MKGTYRIHVRRAVNPADWELVASCGDADEAWALARHWEDTTTVTEVRVDLCVRHWEKGQGPGDVAEASGPHGANGSRIAGRP